MENPEDQRLKEWLASQQKSTKKEINKYVQEWTLRAQLASMYGDVK